MSFDVLDGIVLFEEAEDRLRVRPEEPDLLVAQRQFVNGALDVADGDVRVVRVHHRLLRVLREEVFGVGHQVLVNRRVPADEKDQRILALSAGPARLLPQAGDRAGIPHEEAGVEAADVNAELECVRARHAENLLAHEFLLDLAPLLRQVAAAVGAHRLRQLPRHWPEPVAAVLENQLRCEARAHKRDRLHPLLDERGHQVDRLPERTAPVAADAPVALLAPRRRLERRRVPEHEPLPPARRAVVADQFHFLSADAFGVLLGVGDRR